MMKQCTKCKEIKQSQEFHRHRLLKDGLNTECKKCNIRRANKWAKDNPEAASQHTANYRKKNPEKRRETLRNYHRRNKKRDWENQLKRNYGITAQEYFDMADLQENKCKICQNPEYGKNKSTKLPQKLSVDHCHKTGKIRGLLCAHCNHGLGHFKDNAKVLMKAAKYIEENL